MLQHNQIASLKNYFLNRARDNTFFNALVSADKDYTPLNLSDNIISDIVDPNITDTIANIKQKSLHGRYFKKLEQPEINIQASHAWLKKSNIYPETEGFIFAIQDRVLNCSMSNCHYSFGRGRRPRGPTFARGTIRSLLKDLELARQRTAHDVATRPPCRNLFRDAHLEIIQFCLCRQSVHF
jgi:hypothetical protein